MSIRRKILFYFLSTVLLLTSVILVLIYTIFKEYREEQFQQRQSDKMLLTLELLTEYEEIDEDLLFALDRATIHDIYDEKLLLFDSHKALLYESVDDLSIGKTQEILEQLSGDKTWIETKEGLYDVVGIRVNHKGSEYYGISKAYDKFGYELLSFLRSAFILLFVGIGLLIVWVSIFLSNKISKPIVQLTKQIANYTLEDAPIEVPSKDVETETIILAERFNDLMDKIKVSFSFQRNAVQHISHELNTPIAVLVSNFEKMEQESDMQKLQELLLKQKSSTRRLSQIINALLKLSMAESGSSSVKSVIRVDELLFDICEELKTLYPSFSFQIQYQSSEMDSAILEVSANEDLLRAAFMNLMLNCIRHSDSQQAQIHLMDNHSSLQLKFVNTGKVITEEERKYLFQHFFRGENSQGKNGFGLGLVFIHKILKLQVAEISYQAPDNNTNVFIIDF